MVQEGVWCLSAKRNVGSTGKDEQDRTRGTCMIWGVFVGNEQQEREELDRGHTTTDCWVDDKCRG